MDNKLVHAGAHKKVPVKQSGEGVGACGQACGPACSIGMGCIDENGNPAPCEEKACNEGRALGTVDVLSDATLNASATVTVKVQNSRDGGYLIPDRVRIYGRVVLTGLAAPEGSGGVSDIQVGRLPQEKTGSGAEIPLEEFKRDGCCGDEVCWSWIGKEVGDELTMQLHNYLPLLAGNSQTIRYTVIVLGEISDCKPKGWKCGDTRTSRRRQKPTPIPSAA